MVEGSDSEAQEFSIWWGGRDGAVEIPGKGSSKGRGRRCKKAWIVLGTLSNLVLLKWNIAF